MIVNRGTRRYSSALPRQGFALNTDQSSRCCPLRRMHVTDIVEMGIAWIHHVGLPGPDQRRTVTTSWFDDLPVNHFGCATGLTVNCPARAMIVWLTDRFPRVNVATDAKTEFRVLVEYLAWMLVSFE